MPSYRHHVSGFFAIAQEAESVQTRLINRGLPRERVHLFEAGKAALTAATPAKSDAVLKDVLVDGAVGTVVGAGVGGLAEVALVAANVSLFVASPLIAPLVMLGWGASLGGLLGAMAGAGTADKRSDPAANDGKFATLIADAISSGQVVLVVETLTEQETAIARQVINTAVGESRDLIPG